jgi:CubicO group peptidase (beta-lactamase class C family)
MQRAIKWGVRLTVALVALVVVGMGVVLVSPPDLLRVGTGYAAKIVCSNVFIAGRDADEVLRDDVQAPGHPLLKLVGVDVDLEGGLVRAAMLGIVAPSHAVYRTGLGCAVVAEADIGLARRLAAPVSEAVPADEALAWPEGEAVPTPDPDLADVLGNADLLGPSARAVVVVKDGQIVGEAYGPGFNQRTPLLGWSMTKTVTATLLGLLQGEGRIDLEARALFPEWSGDARREIALADLLAMQSGLRFNENYGDVTDVTRMLYLEPDMGAYVASLPSEAPPGTRFNYSSGETVLISRYWMSRFADQAEALAFPRRALFDALGMRSAVLEPDQAGTFVGSSYLYATARDWARFGLLIAESGNWAGRPLLDPAYVARITEPSETSDGAYTRAQAWQNGPQGADNDFGLPEDTVWMLGHDGQSIAVIPSERLVVVRLGLTPRRLEYRPQRLVEAVRAALR